MSPPKSFPVGGDGSVEPNREFMARTFLANWPLHYGLSIFLTFTFFINDVNGDKVTLSGLWALLTLPVVVLVSMIGGRNGCGARYKLVQSRWAQIGCCNNQCIVTAVS
jgi:hypothetical protein